MEWTFWAIVGAAVIHINEEYWRGFILWFPKFIGLRITRKQFISVNSLFLLLCMAGALVGTKAIIFSLSIASLVFINAWLHIFGAIKARQYSPGLVSGVCLYVPLAVLAYYLSARSGYLTSLTGLWAFLLGGVWHTVPLGFHLLYQRLKGV